MELAEIENTNPKETVRELIETGRFSTDEDVFSQYNLFFSDVTLRFEDDTITFQKVGFFSFARDLIDAAFDLNFRQAEQTQIRTLSPGRMLITAEIIDDTVSLRFDIADEIEVTLNRESYQYRDSVFIEASILSFNRTCGAFFKAALARLDDIYEGIDGVEEYFGNIKFSGEFLEAWKYDD
jgi:hypothetical protein